MVKVLLAIFVGLFRQNVAPLEEDTMTPLEGLDSRRDRGVLPRPGRARADPQRRLQERYALLWLLTGLVLTALAAWRAA